MNQRRLKESNAKVDMTRRNITGWYFHIYSKSVETALRILTLSFHRSRVLVASTFLKFSYLFRQLRCLRHQPIIDLKTRISSQLCECFYISYKLSSFSFICICLLYLKFTSSPLLYLSISNLSLYRIKYQSTT